MNNQEAAFEKLSKLKCGALFMEMGTGKTKVALDIIASKVHKIDYVLWICPCSIKLEIENEKEKWHPELKMDVVGCESIGASDRIYLEILEKCENNKTFIVVDESLKIKNRNAKRTLRILEMGKHSEYRLILNGTSLSKNVLDLWTQMEFLSPKILDMTYWQFKNKYCEYYTCGALVGKVKRQHNIDHLVAKIKPYIFDCDLEIEPKKNYFHETYSMSEERLKEYQNIKEEFLNNCMDFDRDIDFYALTTMLQSCYTEAKEYELESLINDINEPTIIFVKFLKSIPDGALKIIGNMNSDERKKAIEKFKNEGGQLYITYGCGSYGLNLQFCNNVIFSEHCFDYAQRIQAEARVYRMGQNKDVNYYNLWCDCGLEKLIRASLYKKSGFLYEVKAEIEAMGVEEWVKNI